MEPGLEGLSLRFSTSLVLLPAPLPGWPGPRVPQPSRAPLPPPRGPPALGPGRGRSLPGTFSRQQPWSPGETRGPPGAPPAASCRAPRQAPRPVPRRPAPAFTPVPPPPAPCPVCACAPGPSARGRAAHVGLRTAPPPPVGRRGLALATPLRAPPPRGALAWRMRLPSAPAERSACCAHVRGGLARGLHLREAPSPRALSGGKAAGAAGCAHCPSGLVGGQ